MFLKFIKLVIECTYGYISYISDCLCNILITIKVHKLVKKIDRHMKMHGETMKIKGTVSEITQRVDVHIILVTITRYLPFANIKTIKQLQTTRRKGKYCVALMWLDCVFLWANF